MRGKGRGAISTYAISDIHGCYDEFMEMLKKIRFSRDDTLILAGDYIDRGRQNAQILQWLEKRLPNVVCLKGNHDAEFAANADLMLALDFLENLQTDFTSSEDTRTLYDTVKYYYRGKDQDDSSLYFDFYGSIGQMIGDGATLADLKRWSKRVKEMPYVYETDITGRHYIIVHAGYIEDLAAVSSCYESVEEFYLYAREEGYEYGGKAHCTVIAGHTPTVLEGNFSYNGGKVFQYYDEKKDCTFYDIDCGCSLRAHYPQAALACIRLEDEEIFYL